MRQKGPLYVFYVSILTEDGTNTHLKQKSTTKRRALVAALKRFTNEPVVSARCGDGIPVKEHSRQEALNRKRGAKEAAKKRAAKWTWTTEFDDDGNIIRNKPED